MQVRYQKSSQEKEREGLKQENKEVCQVDVSGLRGKSNYEIRSFFSKLGRESKKDLSILMDELAESEAERKRLASLAAESILSGAYHFRKEGLKEIQGGFRFGDRQKCIAYEPITVTLISDTPLAEEVRQGELLGRCKGYARLLGDLPNNYLRTDDFVAYTEELVKSLSEEQKQLSSGLSEEQEQLSSSGLSGEAAADPAGRGRLTGRILRNKELSEKNCGGILAVNQAASQEAAMLELVWQGGEQTEGYTALVGKGVLFDSGGYHLKNMDGMEGMKYDMCGAADVLELMEYAVLASLKKNLTAIIPLAENVISQDGVKMGDVITTMSGKTVEIYNTDAEGRLLLCDALTYACESADHILDFATLTYSCKNALGTRFTGVFSNDDDYFERAKAAADRAGEKVWRMPLDESFHEDIKWSKTADLANYAPGKCAAASTAACFLEEFIPQGKQWIHFDMVGTAVHTGDSKELQEGATGAMISTAAGLLKQV